MVSPSYRTHITLSCEILSFSWHTSESLENSSSMAHCQTKKLRIKCGLEAAARWWECGRIDGGSHGHEPSTRCKLSIGVMSSYKPFVPEDRSLLVAIVINLAREGHPPCWFQLGKTSEPTSDHSNRCLPLPMCVDQWMMGTPSYDGCFCSTHQLLGVYHLWAYRRYERSTTCGEAEQATAVGTTLEGSLTMNP